MRNSSCEVVLPPNSKRNKRKLYLFRGNKGEKGTYKRHCRVSSSKQWGNLRWEISAISSSNQLWQGKCINSQGGKHTLRDCKAHQPITVGEPYLNVDWIFNDTEELLLTFLICDQLFKRPNFLEQGFSALALLTFRTR